MRTKLMAALVGTVLAAGFTASSYACHPEWRHHRVAERECGCVHPCGTCGTARFDGNASVGHGCGWEDNSFFCGYLVGTYPAGKCVECCVHPCYR